MKATYFYMAGALSLTFAIAACVAGPDLPPPVIAPSATSSDTSAPDTRPPPPPPDIVLSPPPDPIIPERRFENYLDAPQTAGTWTYINEPNETLATFGLGTDYEFIVRCDKSTGQIGLGRVLGYSSPTPLNMTVQAETTKRELTAERPDRQSRIVAATLNARDPLLDAIAITKGRIAIGVQGQYTLYLPAWVEISRVIEDCR